MSFFYLCDKIKLGDDMKKIMISFFILILILILILFYSRYVGTTGLNIKEYKVNYSELKEDFYGLKIAHISDIHYKSTISKEELNKLVKKINLTKPDIVVLTGDLFTDKDITDNDEKDIIDALSKINVNIEKYAIKGDNDSDKWDNIINSSGFKNLNNTYDLIYTETTDYILIAGMSSNITDKTSIEEKLKTTNEFIANSEIKPNYNILLMHEPDFVNNFDYSKFNLILAGHSLNGQVRIPYVGGLFKQVYSKKYYEEYYKLKNTDLYISSGLGTYKYSFRLFNHPSFNLYRLTNKQ